MESNKGLDSSKLFERLAKREFSGKNLYLPVKNSIGQYITCNIFLILDLIFGTII